MGGLFESADEIAVRGRELRSWIVDKAGEGPRRRLLVFAHGGIVQWAFRTTGMSNSEIRVFDVKV